MVKMKLKMFTRIVSKVWSPTLYNKNLRCACSLVSFPKHRFKVLNGELTLSHSEREQLTAESSRNEKEYNDIFLRVTSTDSSNPGVVRHTIKNKKILARERIRLLVDRDYPMLELSVFAGLGMDYGDIHSAGSVVVIAKVSGQLCIIGANDATIKGGTIFPITLKKTLRANEIAMQNNLPVLHYVDSGGGFLPLQSEFFADKEHGGRAFYNEAVMNAAGIPQLCIVAGSCTAGGAYIPTMANEVVMVDDIARIFLAGPPLVYAAIGQKISENDLGGTGVHCDVSGVADYRAANEIESIEIMKDVMSTLNMNVCLEEETRHVENPFYSSHDLPLLSLKRDSSNRLDIRKILSRLLDGSRFHEFKPTYGKELITGFARLNGTLIGVVANYGVLTADACVKGVHFITLCSQRGIPVLFLQDIIGNTDDVMLIKFMSELMSAVAVTTVPKITVILGKSYGVSNYAMCGRSMSPRFLYLWPTAKVFIEDIDNIVSAGEYQDVEKESSCYYSSARVWDDGVILPQDTRTILGLSLNACLTHQPVEKSSHINVMRM